MMRPKHHPQIIQKRMTIIIKRLNLSPKLNMRKHNKTENKHNKEYNEVTELLRHILNNFVKEL